MRVVGMGHSASSAESAMSRNRELEQQLREARLELEQLRQQRTKSNRKSDSEQ